MDVMGAFFRGQAAAGRAQADQQALQENKLRLMVLKHQIDGLKIEDQVRQRRMAAEHYSLLEGLPEAQMPTEPVSQPNLPSTSHAGGMTGLPGVVSGMSEMAAPGPAPGPTMPAPAAQAAQPGTNMTTRRQGVTFGAIPEMGIPSATVQPRSMEEILRAQVMAKLNEPFTLNPGDRRFMGGQKIAEGAPREPRATTTADLAVKAASGDEAAGKAVKLLRPGTAAQPANAQQKDVLLDGEEATVLLDPKAKKYYTLDNQEITRAATRIKPLRGGTGGDRDAPLRRDYETFYKLYERTYPAPKNNELAELGRMLSGNAADPTTAAAPAPRPAPSFEKWKVMTPAERQQVLANPDARIDDAEMLRRMGRPSSASTASRKTAAAAQPADVPAEVQAFLKGQPANKRYTLTDGSVWDVLADGTIRRGQSQ